MQIMPSQVLSTRKPTTTVAQRANFALMTVRYKAEIGCAIRARRTELGLTQKELADRCHVEEAQTISRWERGLNLPNDLSVVADALETTISELFAMVRAPNARVARKISAPSLIDALAPTGQSLEDKVDELLARVKLIEAATLRAPEGELDRRISTPRPKPSSRRPPKNPPEAGSSGGNGQS